MLATVFCENVLRCGWGLNFHNVLFHFLGKADQILSKGFVDPILRSFFQGSEIHPSNPFCRRIWKCFSDPFLRSFFQQSNMEIFCKSSKSSPSKRLISQIHKPIYIKLKKCFRLLSRNSLSM